ncbi:GCD1 Nucleoside-diphosphate-sugar pyrophosphorylase involved in lipopolysaccharide biosynthesis/translation initiation factor 2B, gamma/epsilon subunits (eIF-2Bgamma/eIF-2Bepsilon) [Candidatus Nanopelagicaceae bacterium]
MPKRSENWKAAILSPEASVRSAIEKLESTGFQIILIADKELRLLGTVTDGDIRRALMSHLDLDAQVENVMHKNVTVIGNSSNRLEALNLMKKNKVLQVPIIDEHGILVGLHLWDESETLLTRPNAMVIMAGGRGTRLLPHTIETPKPMLQVGGKPILEHIIKRARNQGISRIIISLNYLGEVIENYFQDGSNFGVSITYIREINPLGTAGALSLCMDEFNEPILVTNGDVLTDISYTSIIDFHITNQARATMAIRQYELQNPYGVVTISGDSISGYVEKPISKSFINAGVYVVDPVCLSELEYGAYCDMPTLFSILREKKHRVIAFPIHEPWLDIGRPVDLQDANMKIVNFND